VEREGEGRWWRGKEAKGRESKRVKKGSVRKPT